MTESLWRVWGGIRSTASGHGKAFWALSDQAVVSLGTFLTNILLARHLALPEYGTYTLLTGTLLFLSGFQAALVVYPLSVTGAEADANGLRRLTGTAVGLVLALALPLGAVMLGASSLIGRPELGPYAFAVLVLSQLQETLRRGLMAHLRHREALWGDAVSCLGRAAVVWVLAGMGRLSVEIAFGATALTFGLAGLLQAWQLGLGRPARDERRFVVREFWTLGRWLVLSGFLYALSGYGVQWGLAAFHGLASVAEFNLMINITAVMNPVLLGMSALVVPFAAAVRVEGGVPAARRVTWKYAGQGAAIVVPYCALIALWPERMLRVFYGAGTPYVSLAPLLRLFAYVLLVQALVMTLEALLKGLKESRAAFRVEALAAAAFVTAGLPLIAWSGVLGASLWQALLVTVKVLACWWFIGSATRAERTAARVVPAPRLVPWMPRR